MPRTYTAVIYRDAESGAYIASVPALPGTFTCGETIVDLRHNIREAIEIMIEDLAWQMPPNHGND